MTRTLQTALFGACLALPFLPPACAAIRARTAAAIADEVNVRARPEPRSEVIGQLANSRRVTVLEEVAGETRQGSKALWSRIALPSDSSVWVFGDFVDAETGEVKARLLNVRSGKGEEHAILGVLLQGEHVEQLSREGDWLKIKAPIGTYGYVASEYLETVRLFAEVVEEATAADDSPPVPVATADPAEAGETSPPVDATPEEPLSQVVSHATLEEALATPEATLPKEASTDADVEADAAPAEPVSPEETASVVPVEVRSPSEAPADPVVVASSGEVMTTPAVATERAPVIAPSPTPTTHDETAETPLASSTEPSAPVPVEMIVAVDSRPNPPAPRRIALREGIVKRTLSIQAPGAYELRHSASGDRLVYLHPANPKIEIKPFHRRRVRVRGEEFIDPRWPNCAVLLVERITLAP